MCKKQGHKQNFDKWVDGIRLISTKHSEQMSFWMSLQNSLIFKNLVRMPNWDDHPLKNNFVGHGTKDTENKIVPKRF